MLIITFHCRYWTAPAPIDVKTATKADTTSAQRSPIRRRGGSRTPARLQRSGARRAYGLREEFSNASGRSTPGPAAPWPMPPHPRRSEEYSSRNSRLSSGPPPLTPAGWALSGERSYDAYANYQYYPSVPERSRDGSIWTHDTRRRREAGRDTAEDAQRFRALRSLSVDGPRADGRTDNHPRQLAPLRRTSRRNVADGPLPGSSLRESWRPVSSGSTPNATDGLGDRERSISPAAENDTTDAWDTMLTTITPDVQLPSFDSSFTSAAASASASFSVGRSQNTSQSRFDSDTRSSSTSAASSATHLTVPSPMLAPVRTTEPECTTDTELSLASGSDTDEDDPETAAASEYLARTRHPRSPPRPASTYAMPEMRETLRHRPWLTSAVRDEPTYQAEAELRRITARRDARRAEARERAALRQQNLVSDISRLQQHSRELDRQMDELRHISNDIDRRQFERELEEREQDGQRGEELQQRHPRDDEGRSSLTPMGHYISSQERGRDNDVSRFISHFETFRAARDAVRRNLDDVAANAGAHSADAPQQEHEHHRVPNTETGTRTGDVPGMRALPPPTSVSFHSAGNDDASNAPTDNDNDPTLSRDEMLGNDPELESMRAILERLSQRLDIPSSWWRSAGLSTVLPRGRL